jgi:hypothetical protein
MAYLRPYLSIYLEVLRKNHENPSQNNPFPGRVLEMSTSQIQVSGCRYTNLLCPVLGNICCLF